MKNEAGGRVVGVLYIYFVRKTVKIQNEKRYTSYVAVWQRNGTGLGWIRNA